MKAPHIDIDTFWLPHASSTIAGDIDSAWDAAMIVSIVFFILVIGAMVLFVVQYRRRSENDKTSNLVHNTTLEIAWSAIPLAILVVLFFIGLNGYIGASVAPAESYQVNVTAEKWMWTFSYPNGTISVNKLVVPKGRPVQLVMSSRDVIHSFFVPEFRVKRDVIPGSYTSVWFEATEAKEVLLECAEYCGAGHSNMLASVQVMEEPQFQDWLDNGGEEKGVPPAELGKRLFATYGCSTCHSLDGRPGQGPSLKGLYGRNETMSNGMTVLADDNYIRESIEISTAKVVKGFNPIMPVFKGVLKDKQIDALVAFVKEQK
jgi:cytochrome c oxidase subunit 2